jgi:hypothetical protein
VIRIFGTRRAPLLQTRATGWFARWRINLRWRPQIV